MIRSSFFNSLNGDRKYNASNFAEYFATFIGNGVFLESFDITTNENMTITVKAGKGWINGYIVINDDDYILNITNADGILNRIDRVVLRWDGIDREIRLEVKKGVFATSPVAPVLQRDNDGFELAICDILIPAGAAKITTSNIVDTRENKNLCGYVDSLIAGNIELLRQKVDNIEIGVAEHDLSIPNKLDKTGDAKDNIVTFTEASVDSDISTGEKLSILFGKLKKRINNIISNITNLSTLLSDHRNSTVVHVTQNDKTTWDGKAPSNHASSGTTYGPGTPTLHGHVKTINTLTQASHVDGTALSAYQGKVLNDKINSIGYVTGTYTGDGTSDNSKVINLGFKPKLVLIINDTGNNDGFTAKNTHLGAYTINLLDVGFSVSTGTGIWVNTSGKVYSYVAFK